MNAQTEGPYKVLGQIIGKGSFGVVKLGLNKNTGKLVAIKTERKSQEGKKSLLVHENSIVRASSAYAVKPEGLVHSRYFWEDKSNYYLVMDLMGPSIDSLHRLCSRSFSLKTTLMLTTQMLDLLIYYHSHDVIHRDIKPANFLISYTVPHRQVSLIDFGLAKKYKIKGKQIPFASGANQVGSLRYMSKYVHSSIEPSCRDDLYSLGYCIVFMFTGLLPWQGEHINIMDKAERKQYVGKLKHDTKNTTLVINCHCVDCARAGRECPFQGGMLDYFNYLDTLEYDTAIDYKKLTDSVRECFRLHGFVFDYQWDWSKYYITASSSSGMRAAMATSISPNVPTSK